MGLLKTAAKVAVASAVHGRVQRHQQNKWAEQDAAALAAQAPPVAALPAPVAAPAAPVVSDMDAQLARLAQLGDLKAAGVLTEAEFETQKARILGS
jgi:hypothetical protein